MNIKTNKTLAFIVGLYLLISIRPSFTWSIPGNIILLLQVIPIMIFLPRLELKKTGNVVYFIAFFLMIFMISWIRGFNILYSLFLLSFSFLPIVNHKFLTLSFEYFRKIYIFVIGISLITLILVSLGVPLPSKVIPPLNEAKPYNYFSYPFLVIPTFADSFRFHGPFGEPGEVGTIGLILLVIKEFKIKDFWNVILLIACILSFSFAFYLGSIVYLVLRFIINRERYIGYLLIGVFGFYLITSNIPVFNEELYSRFQFDEQAGKLIGDNRSTESMDDYLKSIRWSHDYYWGADKNKMDIMDLTVGSAGIVKAVIINGVVYISLYCLLFWSFAIYNKLTRSQVLLFIVIMLMNLYHRPSLFDFSMFYLYTAYIKYRVCENEGFLLLKQT